MTQLRSLADRFLGLSMYLVVLGLLVALAVVAIVLSALGEFTEPLTVPAMLTALVVLVVASVLANRLCAMVVGADPHDPSALITALLLWFLFWPTTAAIDLGWLAVAAALANLSKYVVVWRGRHLLNPAAAGAFAAVAVQTLVGRESPINATWWVAAEPLLPFVAVAAAVVVWRVGTIEVAASFMIVAAAIDVAALSALGQEYGAAARTALVSFPIVFAGAFMVTEPLTLPPRRWQRIVVSLVMAVVFSAGLAMSAFFSISLDLGLLTPTPELAILAGNLVALVLARPVGTNARTTHSTRLVGDVHEFVVRPVRPVAFVPGQWVEVQMAGRSDRRGRRRVFSIVGRDAEGSLRLSTRIPAVSPSAFKTAWAGADEQTRVRLTRVGGDFVPGRRPAAWVAAGIGITPFLAHLSEQPSSDVTLVHAVNDADAVAFRDELAASGVPVTLVAPTAPSAPLPAHWTFVASDRLTPQIVRDAVSDLGERDLYLSGSPAAARSLRRGLRRDAASVKVDAFTGY